MGNLNNLCAAALVALAMPAAAMATTPDMVPLGGLAGGPSTAPVIDGARDGSLLTLDLVQPTLRPISQPAPLVLSVSDTGATSLSVVPLPGALPLLLVGVAAFGAVASRRKTS